MIVTRTRHVAGCGHFIISTLLPLSVTFPVRIGNSDTALIPDYLAGLLLFEASIRREE
jgi:hypothetical protein